MINWEQTYRRHQRAVWRTAYRLLGNHADAVDCLQDTFLAALEFSRSREVRDWPALLQHLATARAIDRLRRRARESRHLVRSADVGNVAADNSDPAEFAEQADLVERLRQALAELPQQQAEVYCLRFINDLSYEQIGDQLGISTGSVGSLLHRGRARLRILMSPCLPTSRREDPDDTRAD